MAAEVRLDNYVVTGKSFTWSAFTFEQMVPQKVSWVIMRQNANVIRLGKLDYGSIVKNCWDLGGKRLSDKVEGMSG